MALSIQQQFANQFSASVKKPSLLDRAAHEISGMAKGAVPSLLDLGSGIANDLSSPITGNPLQTPGLGKTMASNFMESSFIPALATGHPIEAAKRIWERPVSGFLDLTMIPAGVHAATKVGTRIGPDASRASFARLGGYQELHPIHGASFDASLMDLAGGNPAAFDRMPATLKFHDPSNPFGDASRGAAREYLGKPDYLKIGDSHFLRRTERSVLPAGVDNMDSSLAPMHRNQLQYPTGSFGEDPRRMETTPRAQNEMWAKAGDATMGAFEQFAPHFTSKRLARKLHRKLMTRGRVTGDTVVAGEGRIFRELDDQLKERFPNLDDATRRSIVGQALYVDASGVGVDELPTHADRYDPLSGDTDLNADQSWLDMTPLEALESHGVSIAGGINNVGADPLRSGLLNRTLRDIHEDPDVDPSTWTLSKYSPAQRDALIAYRKQQDDLHAQMGEMFDHDDVAQGFVNINYRNEHGAPQAFTREAYEQNPEILEQLIEQDGLRMPEGDGIDESAFAPGVNNIPWVGQRKADEALAQLNELGNRGSARAIQQIDNPLIQMLVEQHAGLVGIVNKPHLNRFIRSSLVALREGRAPSVEEIAHAKYRRDVDMGAEDIIRPVYDTAAAKMLKSFQGMTGRDRIEAVRAATGDDPARIRQKLVDEHHDNYDKLIDQYRRLKDARFQSAALNERTRAGLSFKGEQGWTSPDYQAPGIVETTRAMAEGEQADLIKSLLQDPKFREYADFKDETTRSSGEAMREVLGGNRLDDDRIRQNETRLNRWLTGNAETDAGKFFSMKYNRKDLAPEGVKVNQQMGELTSVADQKVPGSPFEVFLNGDIDMSPDVHVRNYLQSNDLRTQQRLVDAVREASLSLDDKTLNDYVAKGAVVEEAKIGKRPSERPWVLLAKDGPLIKDIKRIQGPLAEIVKGLRQRGRHHEADEIENLFDSMSSLDPTLSKYDRTVREAAEDKATDRPKRVEHHVLPTPIYAALKKEVEDSHRVVAETLKLVGKGWKVSVLHARFPSWFRNNLIGAQIMLAMSGGIRDFAPSYERMLQNKDRLEHHFPEASELGSTHIARGIDNMRLADSNPAMRKMFDFFNKMSDFNQKWADSPARLARTQQIFDEKVSQLQHMARENGHELADTDELREAMLQDPGIRDKIAQEMLHDMVDFSDMSRMEREWISAFFPFWSWMKGSAKASMRMEADHPERVWAAAEMAEMGMSNQVEEQGTTVPDFARSWYNLGGHDFSTAGWNPYEAPLDLVNMGLGFVPGGMSYGQFGTENLLGSMHPVISGGMAAVLGKDPFFGTPLPQDNPMDRFLTMQLRNPIIKGPQSIIDPETSMRSTTSKSTLGAIANLIGIPTVDPRWQQVRARGIDESQERWANKSAGLALNGMY